LVLFSAVWKVIGGVWEAVWCVLRCLVVVGAATVGVKGSGLVLFAVFGGV
jgi:hypothetical protein